jgi:hypothetical protein
VNRGVYLWNNQGTVFWRKVSNNNTKPLVRPTLFAHGEFRTLQATISLVNNTEASAVMINTWWARRDETMGYASASPLVIHSSRSMMLLEAHQLSCPLVALVAPGDPAHPPNCSCQGAAPKAVPVCS